MKNIQPFFYDAFTREKHAFSEFSFSLKKAFSLLGEWYAPLFFASACIAGGVIPFFVWKFPFFVNALIGARGVGVMTSELVRTMIYLLVGGALFLVARMMLFRLEGKMREVFFLVARMCALFLLFLLGCTILPVFLLNFFGFSFWKLFVGFRSRAVLIFLWAFFMVWFFFSSVTSVVLRVQTLGDFLFGCFLVLSFFLLCTRDFFVSQR